MIPGYLSLYQSNFSEFSLNKDRY